LVLSDRDIEREIEARNIIVEPPAQSTDIQPSSLDVHLGHQILRVKKTHPALHQVIDISHPDIGTIFKEIYTTENISEEDGYELKPGEFILSTVQERITLCSKISASIEGTSTLARFGLTVHSTAPTVHATYLGNLTLELCNHGKLPFILRRDMKIAQLIFEYLKTPSRRTLQSLWQGK
jgi:dCTP deaminase